MNEWFINVTLTDAKNKNYECEFIHPNNHLKIGCKYLKHLDGEDYFIYNEYFNGKCYHSEFPVRRSEIVLKVQIFMETPAEKLIHPEYL